MIIRCRLSELLEDKGVSPDALAEMTGIDPDTVRRYCDEMIESISLRDAGAMLDALNCTAITDLLEAMAEPNGDSDATASPPPSASDEWYSQCPVSPTGRHKWRRDEKASDAIYQEYECDACKRRFTVIW